jgi:outer membrane immunogenic protein
MKKLLLSGVAFVGLAAAPAFAADLSTAPLYKAPPPVPVFSWTGCYIGGSIGGGYAWNTNTNTVNTSAFGDLAPGQGFAQSSSGFVGGGQIGCNYQLARFVIGVEGSYLGANIKGDYANPYNAADDVFTNKIDNIASVTARFGTAFDNWLFYTKAGWAGAHAKLSVVDNVGPLSAPAAPATGTTASLSAPASNMRSRRTGSSASRATTTASRPRATRSAVATASIPSTRARATSTASSAASATSSAGVR